MHSRGTRLVLWHKNGPPTIDQQANRRLVGHRKASGAKRGQGLEPRLLTPLHPRCPELDHRWLQTPNP
ncbi:unnamed protein product [Camellia sinensis]